MKNWSFKTCLLISFFAFSACQKQIDLSLIQNDSNNTTVLNATASNSVGLHNYGLIPMQVGQWKDVPNFTPDIFKSSVKSFGLSSTTTMPSSYLLATPTVRDQGKIGACTGFCGAEANEILNYYLNINNAIISSGLTIATGLSSAATKQFIPNSGAYASLSPLFIYYVERCVINKQSITTDNGAYMVNILQTLQGLSNNTALGVRLSSTISGNTYYFKGDCTEALYAYPSNGLNTSTQYKTAPTNAAITNGTSYSIGTQLGTISSSGSTTHGYFLINSTDPVVDVRTAIYNKKPVLMGFNVYDNKLYKYFEGLGVAGYAPTNYTYNPLDSTGKLITGLKLMGGHAVPIVGYIDDVNQPGGGVFICQNSWSASWGYKGYFYLPYSVLRSQAIVAPGSLYVAII